MGKTSIEWTASQSNDGTWHAGYSFNPWVGCTKVSAACAHCYAEAWARRTGHPELWQGERRRTTVDYWRQPMKWDRAAEVAGMRRRVFCASLADVFDNQVPSVWREDLWTLIYATLHLDWLLLTKRPQNIAKMLPRDWGDGWPNVWLGTTAENQEEADRRIPHLLNVPARVHFLSCEPLLGPVDLLRTPRAGDTWDWLTGERERAREKTTSPRIDWVIAGGESGSHARPSHPDWIRSLRDQCDAAGTAFFFKQWGEWFPGYDRDRDDPDWRICDRVANATPGGQWLNLAGGQGFHGERVVRTSRVGKKLAGALLDGREHREFPRA